MQGFLQGSLRHEGLESHFLSTLAWWLVVVLLSCAQVPTGFVNLNPKKSDGGQAAGWLGCCQGGVVELTRARVFAYMNK